jgi:predicted DNA-binding transcriptional regulator AlpA
VQPKASSAQLISGKDETAARFGISLQTINNWIRDGRLPHPIYFSRQICRFPIAAIEAFESDAANSRPPGPPRLPREKIEEADQ